MEDNKIIVETAKRCAWQGYINIDPSKDESLKQNIGINDGHPEKHEIVMQVRLINSGNFMVLFEIPKKLATIPLKSNENHFRK